MPQSPSLDKTHPHLVVEWDSEKNSREVTEVTFGSGYRAFWVCPSGHEWSATVANRAGRASGCPTCANQKPRKYPNRKPREVVPREGTSLTDLGSADLVGQWSSRNEKSPSQVSAQSNKYAYWICSSGHEWSAKIQNRFMGAGCPMCAGFVAVAGKTDLATKKPKLIKEWHPTKNSSLTPQAVTEWSGKKVWWLGFCGHEWESTVAHRSGGSGCIYCSGHTVLVGFNDLATKKPELAREWHPTKNSLSPKQITGGSSIRVWWLCSSGHEWVASPADRPRTGCPECAARKFTSGGENDLYGELVKYIPDLQSTYRKIPGVLELDMYSPEHKIGIEFNGLFWHSELNKPKYYHFNKTNKCEELGIKLIHVWEDDWKNKKEIVLKTVLTKFNRLSQDKVSARSCLTTEISHVDAKTFLEENHIQGYCVASKHFGLFDGQKNLEAILSITTTKRGSTVYRIDRYASKNLVRGGFTKLLKFAERNVEVSEWITFADRTYSSGDLYLNSGFVQESKLPPDYKYVYRNKRRHKFAFRKNRVQKNPNLKFEEGLTESGLASLNNIYRIWDAGKIKFNKKVVR